jgi:hypothetical protein
VLRRYRAHAWWSHLEKLPSDEDRRAYMAGEILAAASPDLPAVPVALTGDVPLAVPEHWALPEASLPVAPAPAESAGDAGAAT